MKNLKNYFFIGSISVLTSLIFFACTKENDIDNNKNIENVTNSPIIKASTKRTAAIDSWITGSTVLNPHTPNASAVVVPGTTAIYTYNSSPTAVNIHWEIYPAGSNPGITFIGSTNNSTVTVSFSSLFTGGSIKAFGTDPNGQDGNPVLPITIPPNSGPDCSCTPLFRNDYYNVPAPDISGPIENAIYFGNRPNCVFNWSTVSSIKIQYGGILGVGSNSLSLPNVNTLGQSGGMKDDANWTTIPSGFRNIKIRNHLNGSNVDPGFIRNATLGYLGGWVTITFNNGCPEVILGLNDIMELAPIE